LILILILLKMLKYWATRSPLLGQLPLQPLKMLLFLWCLAEAATATVFAPYPYSLVD